MDYHPQAALVTGASSGLGEAFARALAERGTSMLLTALPRDEIALRNVAEDLRARHHLRIQLVLTDLTEPGAAQQLRAVADEAKFEPDLLVNNAGVGLLGPFRDLPLERQVAMLRLNVEAVVALTHLYLPRMVARRNGAIINVASTAAFAPIPYLAVYAASKAFILSFSEALWAESRRFGVRVVGFCPGPVAETNFGKSAEPHVQAKQRFFPQISREAAVAAALVAVERNRPRAVRRVPIIGQVATLFAFAPYLLPLSSRLAVSERLVDWYFRLGQNSDP